MMNNTGFSSRIPSARFSLWVSISVGISACTNNDTPQNTIETNKDYNEVKFADSNASKDAQVLIDIALLHLEEIKLGQLAQKNGSAEDVKELGKMMEQAHTSSFNELTVLAQNKMVTIPTTMGESGNELLTKMSSLKGADFDEQYCDIIVTGHKKAIDLLDRIAQESRDADIKQFANQNSPILKSHLEHAIACQEKYK